MSTFSDCIYVTLTSDCVSKTGKVISIHGWEDNSSVSGLTSTYKFIYSYNSYIYG